MAGDGSALIFKTSIQITTVPVKSVKGADEVKVFRDGKLTRTLKVTVGTDGKIVDNEIVQTNNVTGFRIVVPAQVLSDTDGTWEGNAWNTEML